MMLDQGYCGIFISNIELLSLINDTCLFFYCISVHNLTDFAISTKSSTISIVELHYCIFGRKNERSKTNQFLWSYNR